MVHQDINQCLSYCYFNFFIWILAFRTYMTCRLLSMLCPCYEYLWLITGHTLLCLPQDNSSIVSTYCLNSQIMLVISVQILACLNSWPDWCLSLQRGVEEWWSRTKRWLWVMDAVGMILVRTWPTLSSQNYQISAA